MCTETFGGGVVHGRTSIMQSTINALNEVENTEIFYSSIRGDNNDSFEEGNLFVLLGEAGTKAV